MKNLFIMLLITALSSITMADQSCKVLLSVYGRASLPAADVIKTQVQKNITAAVGVRNLRECTQRRADAVHYGIVDKLLLDTPDRTNKCGEEPYVFSRFNIAFGSQVSQECLNAAYVSLLQLGFQKESIEFSNGKPAVFDFQLDQNPSTIQIIVPFGATFSL